MIKRSILNTFILAMTIVSTLLTFGVTTAYSAEKAYFVDILYLQQGKTTKDAKIYFDRTSDVVEKHGLVRITPAFEITNKMSGNIDPQLINVWSVSDPKNTFNNIFSDQDYLKHLKLRDSTFDMSRSHMFMMRATE